MLLTFAELIVIFALLQMIFEGIEDPLNQLTGGKESEQQGTGNGQTYLLMSCCQRFRAWVKMGSVNLVIPVASIKFWKEMF